MAHAVEVHTNGHAPALNETLLADPKAKWPPILRADGTPFPHDGRSVAIIGMSKRSTYLAPRDFKEWCWFSLNNAHKHLQMPPDNFLWSEMHTPEWVRSRKSFQESDWKFLAEEAPKRNITVFSLKHVPEWPTSVEYPRARIRATYPRVPWDSSMANQLALAIEMVRDGIFKPRIGIWGVDMLDDYSKQGPGFGYLVAQAEFLGIEIVLPKGSAMFKQPFEYGYDDPILLARQTQLETREQELQAYTQNLHQNKQALESQLAALNTQISQAQGAIGENAYQRKNWTINEGERD